jgi:hypothetical protein
MGLRLVGQVLRLREKNRVNKTTGEEYVERQAYVQHGVGSVLAVLSRDVPTPAEGEVVDLDVSPRAYCKRNSEGQLTGEADIWWTAWPVRDTALK